MWLLPRCPAHFVQDPTSLANDTNDDLAAKLAKLLLRYQFHRFTLTWPPSHISDPTARARVCPPHLHLPFSHTKNPDGRLQ